VNPLGIVIIGIGLVMIVIGFKGTQHQIVTDITGAKTQADAAESNDAANANPTDAQLSAGTSDTTAGSGASNGAG
jgi:hypothetical protein